MMMLVASPTASPLIFMNDDVLFLSKLRQAILK